MYIRECCFAQNNKTNIVSHEIIDVDTSKYCFAWNNDYFSSHLLLQTAYACPSTSYSFAIADIHLPI